MRSSQSLIVLLLVGVLPMFAGQGSGQAAAIPQHGAPHILVSGQDFSASVPSYGSAQVIASGQGFPISIAVGKDGTVFWANQNDGRLQSLPRGASNPITLLSGLSNVQGVGVDSAGNVYYDEYFQGILYELPKGSSAPHVLATGLNYPNFMSVDAAGNVYFITGQTCGNTIVEYNAKTRTVLTIITLTGMSLGGVFIHPSGDLYFGICSNNPLQIGLLAKGSSTPQIVYSASQQNPQWYNWVNGIAVDAARNIFFTVYALSVQVLPAGSSTPSVLATGSADGFAHQLALDQSDNVYFTDSYAGNVWKISAEALMTVSYAVVGGGTPSSPVFNYTLGGTPQQYTLTTTPNALTVDAGSSWSVTNPLLGSGASERWWTSPSKGTAKSQTLAFQYQHQFKLTMKANPSSGGSVTPSSTWQNSSVSVNIQATPNANFGLVSWTGSGTGSYSGTNNPATVTMNGAITETANFQQTGGQLSLSLISPRNGATVASSDPSGSLLIFIVKVQGSVQSATVIVFLDGNQVCSGLSDPNGYYVCGYSGVQRGNTHSWYATAAKTGFTSGTSPTWTFTY